MDNNQNNRPESKLFTELFRPQTLEQTILLPRVYNELNKGLCDNILLYGKAGIGKTCCSRIMAKLASEVLEINASLENGVDTIREKVMQFASSNSLFGGEQQLKVVQLEECDFLSANAWASLRATIEQFHSTTRFIANCNYIDKIPEPIQSRFNCICLEPTNPDEENYLINKYVERVTAIMNACKIANTPELVLSFVKNDFPDLRTLVKKIQQMYTRGTHELTYESISSTFDCADLLQMICNTCDPVNNYKMLSANWSNKAEDAVLLIGQNLPNYIMTTCPNKINKLPLICISQAEYQNMLPNSIDKFIVLLALVYKMQMILNS